MKLIRNGLDLTLQHSKNTLLTATKACPMLYVGQGSESVEMYRGNFTIEDYVTERRPLMISDAEDTKDGLLLNFENELTALVRQDVVYGSVKGGWEPHFVVIYDSVASELEKLGHMLQVEVCKF